MFRFALPKGWQTVKQITCSKGHKFISLLDHPDQYKGHIIVYSPGVLHDEASMKFLRAEMQSRQCGLALFATLRPCFAWLRTYSPQAKSPLPTPEYLINADHLNPIKLLEECSPIFEALRRTP